MEVLQERRDVHPGGMVSLTPDFHIQNKETEFISKMFILILFIFGMPNVTYVSYAMRMMRVLEDVFEEFPIATAFRTNLGITQSKRASFRSPL